MHVSGGAFTGGQVVDADINSVNWSKVGSPPTTILGYGITDNLVNTVNGRKGEVIVKNADSIKGLPVDTSLRRNGYVLAFDSIAHNWYLAANGTGGGASNFSGLSDVSITSPINNQFPVYNSGTSKWTNITPSTTLIPEGVNLYWTNSRFDTRFNTKSTDSLPEGTNNLYFTTTRVRNSVSGASPLSYSSASGVMSIQNALADGTTKGASSFNANDFNDNGTGLISIDYINGQLATNSVNGFLSSSNHTTFNNKIDSTSKDISGNVYDWRNGSSVLRYTITSGGSQTFDQVLRTGNNTDTTALFNSKNHASVAQSKPLNFGYRSADTSASGSYYPITIKAYDPSLADWSVRHESAINPAGQTGRDETLWIGYNISGQGKDSSASIHDAWESNWRQPGNPDSLHWFERHIEVQPIHGSPWRAYSMTCSKNYASNATTTMRSNIFDWQDETLNASILGLNAGALQILDATTGSSQ